MTDEEARALGERWIKAGGGWRPGIDMRGAIYLRIHNESTDQIVPDFRFGATRGAALDVVRKRRGCPEAFLFRDLSRWEVSAWVPNARGRVEAHTLGAGATDAEALVAALETHDG